jgi:hypothetical protein
MYDNQEVVLDMDMKVEWVDGKLFDPLNALTSARSRQITLNPVFLKKIWKPDIYIGKINRLTDVKDWDLKISVDLQMKLSKLENLRWWPNLGRFYSHPEMDSFHTQCGTKSNSDFTKSFAADAFVVYCNFVLGPTTNHLSSIILQTYGNSELWDGLQLLSLGHPKMRISFKEL